MKEQQIATYFQKEFLSSHYVFKNLNTLELQAVQNHSQELTFKKNNILYTQGSKPKGFFLIKTGIIKVFKTGHDGKEQIIRFAKENDIIGFRSVLSHENACTTAKVLNETEILFIEKEILFECIKNNGDFALALLQLTCRELEESNNYITDIAQKTVRSRLAEVLIHLSETFHLDDHDFLNISLSREDIANLVGTATESIIRLLSEMKMDQLIDLQGKKIRILDYKRLYKLSGLI